MAIKKVYIGSVGPFTFDDTDPINDPDFPGETHKAIVSSGAVRADDGVATIEAHDLGGTSHNADTLANLNAKVSDATLDDQSASRTPSAHKATHEAGGADKVQTLDSPNVTVGDYSHGGVKVVGAQQAAEADAAAVAALTLDTGTDQVDRAGFNTKLTTLVNEINALKDTVNSLLAKLRTHGLIAT